MNHTFRHALVFVLLAPLQLRAQDSTPEITAGELTAHIKYLASDSLEGRGSGTRGNTLAASYIVERLRSYGIAPAGDSGTYYQSFEFVSAVRLGSGNALTFTGPPAGKTKALVADVEFRPFGFTSNTTVSGPLVFAGYGISAPDKSYDDYSGIDVTGKVVLVLLYSPDGADPHGELNQFSSFRNKARIARDKGAAALIVVTGPNDEQEDELIKLAFDQAFASSGIPAISIKRSAVEGFFTTRTLKDIQDSIKATRRPVTFDIAGVKVALTTEVIQLRAKTANVIGTLPGTDPALNAQSVVLGAHFDHLGYGGPGSGSLVPDTLAVHHGADDNASGTAGLLELAQAFAAERQSLKRRLIFTFFSGEELGTLGSQYYVNHPPFPLAGMTAMVNMDMIGRLDQHTLTVYGTGTSPGWRSLLEKHNTDSTFVLKFVPDGFGPSDHAQFYAKDIPVLFFFTGTHNDYHKPSDTWDRINSPAEQQIVRYVRDIVRDIDAGAERPLFTKAVSTAPAGGGDTRGFRVTLGVVPDYAEGTEGMKIGGLRPGGPAEKAGMKAGDVIVKMGGKKIMNIYDYMGMLGELKAGDMVTVEVLRDGKLLTLTAQMEKRR
ncbi:MAG: M20/M25/M40 family metallo-hydrolase [Bacteroidota bacterium]